MTVIAGSEEGAVFRCRHSSADAFINWFIDGSRPGAGPISQRVNESGTLIDTLTIPATPDFNGSQVVCVAILNEREETPPATLTIVEGIILLC